jgi:D-aminopeptidase
MLPSPQEFPVSHLRLRQLGITIGSLPTGPLNAITDVPGIWVGHTTLVYDEPRVARTGVTAIVPREGKIWHDPAFAGFFSFNGTGEMTGVHWLEESGMLYYPILLTSTHHVGTVHEAMVAYGQRTGLTSFSSLPVVGETYDGWLNDLDAFHIKYEHVVHALERARPGPVEEGNVGGGTGMICHDFKGGIGTASRLVSVPGGEYTLGVLVQANHGDRELLRVDGAPVGLEISLDQVPSPWDAPPDSSSILIIIATDAPLLPTQCKRLARRAALGMGRVGGLGHNFSGDLFLAFSTGNHLPADLLEPYSLRMLPNLQMNLFFQAVAEAVEEAILNCLVAAETMTGFQGHTAYALPADQLVQVMAKYGRLGR